MLLVVVNQTVGRAVVSVDRFAVLQFRQNVLSELFAKFHPPLVEAVDAPDDTLSENLVLVQSNEGA